jgi:hypothetical protein
VARAIEVSPLRRAPESPGAQVGPRALGRERLGRRLSPRRALAKDSKVLLGHSSESLEYLGGGASSIWESLLLPPKSLLLAGPPSLLERREGYLGGRDSRALGKGDLCTRV